MNVLEKSNIISKSFPYINQFYNKIKETSMKTLSMLLSKRQDCILIKTKVFLHFVVLIISFSWICCKDSASGPVEINSDLVEIKRAISADEIDGGNYITNIFIDNNNIFSLTPPTVIHLNNDMTRQKDTVLSNLFRYNSWTYTFANKSIFSSKLLLVFSRYSNVSCGSLYEYDLNSKNLILLKDSTYNISSAVYLKTKPGECIYYTYGNETIGLQAGYYSLNTQSRVEKLIFPYKSTLGYFDKEEYSNGFDISPDDSKIIFPIHTPYQPAKAAFLNLNTLKIDSLDFNFKGQFVWLRFSHDGKKLLYNSYPYGIAGRNVDGNSDMGLIRLNDLSSKLFDVKTSSAGSISMCPEWSPDDKNILFGSGIGPKSEPPGAVGYFSVYLLKNIQ